MNYPLIYDSSNNLLAVLDNVNEDTAEIYERLNSDYEFTFQMYDKELKSNYLTVLNNIEIENQKFDIRYIETNHNDSGSIIYDVECEHVSYRLIEELSYYAFTGTPTEIMQDLLTGTDFSVGVIEYTETQVFVVNEETTKLRIIQLLAASLGGKISFDNKGFTINIKNDIGKDNGYEIRINKNLKEIIKIVDTREEIKTYYKINVIELKNTDYYKKNGFDVLEVVEKGDTVLIKDPSIGVDVVNTILSKTWNPIKSINTTVELLNSIELLSDEMLSFQINSFNKNELIYGVKVTNDEGFVTERTDKKAKSVFNADEFKMQVGNGLGSYTDAVFFDPNNSRYVFTGSLIVQEITGVTADDVDETSGRIFGAPSWRTPGQTTINGGAIEADSITADKINANQLSAISADLGTITAGNITGGNINITTNASVGDRFTLGNPFGNRVDLERDGGNFYIGTNGQRQLKLFTNGTVITDNIFLPGGTSISWLNSFDGTIFEPRIQVLTNTTKFVNRDVDFDDQNVLNVNQVFSNHFIPRSKVNVGDMPVFSSYDFAGTTYNSTVQGVINRHSNDILTIYDKLRDLLNALQSYSLI